MRRISVVAAIAALCAVVPSAVTAVEPPTASQATVVKMIVKRPPRTVIRHERMALPSRPSAAQVLQAIRREAAMWGISAAALQHRATCESGLRWWASNGQYQGVLQFGANAFYRGLSTLRTRKVVDTVVRTRRMHSRVYRHWSDGRLTRGRGRAIMQRVVLTRTALLPRHPAITDVETQLRIGAQAIRGISAVRSSEWSCAA